MKRILIPFLFLITLLFASCDGSVSENSRESFESVEQSEQSAECQDFTFINNGNALYGIVRSVEMGKPSASMTLSLNGRIKELAGKYLGVTNDVDLQGESTPASEYEILVGNTNRTESAEAMTALEPYTFAIKFVNAKIVIVGYNDSLLCDAIEYFTANYLASDKVESGEGELRLLYTEDYVSVSAISDFSELVSSAPALDSEAKVVYTVPRPNTTIKTVQGGCLAGKYFYQAFLKKDGASNEENNIVRIVKYDTEQKKVVKESADLALNHANDITYNSALDTLVVVHNNPNRTHVSYVDPETLEITETKIIEYKIYCIDYNEKTGNYVIGLSGGQSFMVVDADFKAVSEVFQPTEQTSGYTTQGCACDENYIYFVLYNKNVITVYNWEGEFVTLVTLNVGSIEPENVSIAGSSLYVGCASSGCKVFEITLLAPSENSSKE